MADVQCLLVGSAQTIAQRLGVLQEQVPPSVVVYHHIGASAANAILQLQMLIVKLTLSNCKSIQGSLLLGLTAHIERLLRSESLLDYRLATCSLPFRIRVS